ncbi:hypothetical protein DEU56DRAFT_779677 [Suillus clintonianus]|uniref:uncharacterized protein n=1 Tax=Suillus clintonianus TaxID=1904413 RepID=UPI001B87F586|nr:uncharacterized protein DEU56DRAFT_779677 [Suillus clintonianus]KAG2150379.1 hypothetical protein DEU56DRAFT_779677 [Suillus clintonianus]
MYVPLALYLSLPLTSYCRSLIFLKPLFYTTNHTRFILLFIDLSKSLRIIVIHSLYTEYLFHCARCIHLSLLSFGVSSLSLLDFLIACWMYLSYLAMSHGVSFMLEARWE